MDLASYLKDECLTAAAFAGRVGTTRAAVSAWLKGRNKVSIGRVRKIEEITEGRVTRYDLRPDVYEPAAEAPAPEAAA